MGTSTSATIELRNYQQECVDLVLAQYRQYREALAVGDARAIQELRDALIVLPCAAGKTIIFSHIIDALAREYGLNALVVAHRDELLQQAADKYRMVKPDAIIGKVGGGIHEYGGEVTVASIQTVSKPNHIKKLQAIGYGIVIVDESHRVAANGYQEVLKSLPDAFVLMVTATPDRLDGKPIINKPPIYTKNIIEMIAEGYLCDVRAIAIRTEVNLDDLHTEEGDYKTAELDLAVNTPTRNKRVVDAYQEHANGRRAACFCVSIAHAEALSYAFNEHGIPSAIITGDVLPDDRKPLYKAFRDGSIRILCNVNVCTEGWDESLCDCVIMARPTQSRALYVQAIGRSLRLAPAKKDALVLDLTDNCLKHRLQPQSLRRVLNKNLNDNETVLDALAREEQELLQVEKEKQVRKLPEKREKDLHVNLLEKLDWQERDGGMYVLEVGIMKHRIALIPSKQEDGLYHVYARLAPDFKPQCWLDNQPLDWAAQYAEKRARTIMANSGDAKLVDKNAEWRRRPATPKQLAVLSRNHIPYSPFITNGEASDLLGKFFAQQEAKRAEKEKKKEKLSA